jgi:hypothetical protein
MQFHPSACYFNPLGSNIPLSTLFSNTLSLCSIFKAELYVNFQKPSEKKSTEMWFGGEGGSEKIRPRSRWIYSKTRLSIACARAWRHWSISQGTAEPSKAHHSLQCRADMPGRSRTSSEILVPESAGLCPVWLTTAAYTIFRKQPQFGILGAQQHDPCTDKLVYTELDHITWNDKTENRSHHYEAAGMYSVG